MTNLVTKRDTKHFIMGSDGSSKCTECGEFAILPFQTNSTIERRTLLNKHLDIHKFEGDEGDSPVTSDKKIARLYENQVKKMGELIDAPKVVGTTRIKPNKKL